MTSQVTAHSHTIIIGPLGTVHAILFLIISIEQSESLINSYLIIVLFVINWQCNASSLHACQNVQSTVDHVSTLFDALSDVITISVRNSLVLYMHYARGFDVLLINFNLYCNALLALDTVFGPHRPNTTFMSANQ